MTPVPPTSQTAQTSPRAQGRSTQRAASAGGPSYVTWQRHAGRATEIAAALGGRPVHCSFPALTGGVPRTLLRYLLSSVQTAVHLVLARPDAVIVTNPPVVPGLLVTAYGALTHRPVVLDSHPTSFGAKGHAVSRRLLPLHRAMARRAAAVMVTTDSWAEVVDSWGGHGLVVHEAPPQWSVPPHASHAGRPRVLFVGVFGDDEPVDVVVEAARQSPDLDVAITGDPRRASEGLRRSLPPNVELVGFLGPSDYAAQVAAADAVLVLTTEPTSVVRAGYEAVYAGRSLVVSDTPVLREVFPDAVHVAATADAVEAGLRAGVAAAHDGERAQRALLRQTTRWEDQLAALRAVLVPRAGAGATGPSTTGPSTTGPTTTVTPTPHRHQEASRG